MEYSFLIQVDVNDIHFHLALNGSRRRNISNLKTLKGEMTNQGIGKLIESICRNNTCEKLVIFTCFFCFPLFSTHQNEQWKFG
jgi:hypothetical protein